MTPTGFPSREVAIVGVCESPRRTAPGIHPFQIHAEVIAGALVDAGLEWSDVDGFATAATFPSDGGMQLSIAELSEYLGIRPRWFDSTDTGGAAFLTHAGHAALAIASGLCDVVVISYGSIGRSVPLPAPDYNTTNFGPGQYEIPYGPTTVSSYALAARRHMFEFGTRESDLAQIAVDVRANAALNPEAKLRTPITVEEVLSSPMIASPLHKLECCLVTDSGGALVLTSAERARSLGHEPILIAGFGEAIGQVQMNQMADFTSTAGVASGHTAFESAGMRPSDIDCAQLYDSFTITVLLALESLGFAERGAGGRFVREGGISAGGRLPINTDGGGLSSNHPGRRGALALIEGVRQLRGSSPGLQLPSPQACLVHGVGGWLSTAATVVLVGGE
jgi:acetyl-CoA C-acetyltransferase